MHPDEGTSRASVLSAGPSRGPLRRRTGDAVLENVVVDSPVSDPQEPTLFAAVRKPRPLNLSDNYEIVEGVPAFVWRPSQSYDPFYHNYAISTDGTRFAIQEGWSKISVYNMLENFSLVAEWEGVCYKTLKRLTFHNNQNNELILVFQDAHSTVVHLSVNSNDKADHLQKNVQSKGSAEIKQEFTIFDERKNRGDLVYVVENRGIETWVCAWDMAFDKVVTLCSISSKGFRRLQIKSSSRMNVKLTYRSIPQNALMLAEMNDEGCRPMRTRIWQDLDFNKAVHIHSPTELHNSQGFGFSDCGLYFLACKYNEGKENAMEIYEVEQLKKSQNPIARTLLGSDVKALKGQFIQQNQFSLEVLEHTSQKDCPFVVFMVESSNKVELIFWDFSSNVILKRMDITMKEMPLLNQINIEFCISSNMKWIALGCWTEGVFGLFSILSGSLVWSAKLKGYSLLNFTFTLLAFDDPCTKLIINAGHILYVFAPPCLIEDYPLEFQSASLDVDQGSRNQIALLKSQYYALLYKQTLKKALLLRHSLGNQDLIQVLDVANSRITSNTTLLLLSNIRLNVVLGPLETLLTSSFNEYIESGWSRDAIPNGIVDLRIDTPYFQCLTCSSSQHFAWIFMYPNDEKDKDLIVVFLEQDGLLGVFIDDTTGQQDQVAFGKQDCFALKQSEDDNRVVCLTTSSVMVIDLSKRAITRRVAYKANLAKWLLPCITKKNQGYFVVLRDATAILIGWDMMNGKVLTLDSTMNNEDCKSLLEDINNIVPCWCLSKNPEIVVFSEFDEESGAISSICTFNCESNGLNVVKKEQWNLHTRKVLDSVTQNSLLDYTLRLDGINGHLWIIMLQTKENVAQLILIPINPYSLENCVPCLYSLDYPRRNIVEIEMLVSKFGHAFLSMPFAGESNFRLALKNKDKDMMTKLVDVANRCGKSYRDVLAQGFNKHIFNDLLKNIIKDKDEFELQFLLDLILGKHLSFEDRSTLLKEGFEDLWLSYWSLLEQRIINDDMSLSICEINVPIDVLVNHMIIRARMGTSESISQWKEAYDEGNAFTHWKSLHEEHLMEIERRGSNATTIAVVTFFTIANVCKVGLSGIIRFLLMQNAPSYIFKSLLLKWVITFKWQMVWKNRSFWSLMYYLIFTILYTTYSVWIAFVGQDLHDDEVASACLTTILFVLMASALTLLRKEYVQMNTYIHDGNSLFPNDHTWGVRLYFSSMWNLVELLSYVILILFIPILHFASLGGVDVLPILYTIVALETFLIWIKVWYYGQAFSTTGAFVLMIENVIKDCIPFLALAFSILVGFSLALFVLFQHSLQEKRKSQDGGEDVEIKKLVDQCFGDPGKAMITLFYAMIGTFEPKIYYHSGSLSQIITCSFVVYLAIEMIVMVNMLIAIMGDTFDRVKSTEEEQLLLGRARFIDACEAQLTEKEIRELEKTIGKYLYVLLPKEGYANQDTRLWQGRVNTIEERVGKMITISENNIMKKMEKGIDEMKEYRNEIMKMKEDKKELRQMKEDIDEMKEILLLLKDKMLD